MDFADINHIVYKSRLLIYDAGDTRTTWVSFWKAMALLQFGTTLVFAVPPLWNNENQPDPNLRKVQAVLGKLPFLFRLMAIACFILVVLDLSRDFLLASLLDIGCLFLDVILYPSWISV